jgi:hypothetical protein
MHQLDKTVLSSANLIRNKILKWRTGVNRGGRLDIDKDRAAPAAECMHRPPRSRYTSALTLIGLQGGTK